MIEKLGGPVFHAVSAPPFQALVNQARIVFQLRWNTIHRRVDAALVFNKRNASLRQCPMSGINGSKHTARGRGLTVPKQTVKAGKVVLVTQIMTKLGQEGFLLGATKIGYSPRVSDGLRQSIR